MKKLLFLIFIITLVLSASPYLFAKAYQPDENTLIWGPGPDPANLPDGQLWYTFNDWTWVEGSFELDSAWPGDPDTQPWPPGPPFNAPTYALQIRAAANINGILVEPTGYEFDLATAGITGKVIDSVEVINAFWNFPSGANAAVAASFYDPNSLVYTEDPVTMSVPWWQGTVIDFSDNPTTKIRFVIDPYAAVWVWSGNLMYIEQLRITLIDEVDAKCGTRYNPSPEADLNGDCIVDAADIGVLAQYWLACNDPDPASCD